MSLKSLTKPLSAAPARGALLNVWLLGLSGMLALVVLVGVAWAAQPPVGLGTADSFAVLAGSTVTNTGPSTINGDLGVNPGTAITGFPPGTVNGTIHAADAVSAQAQSDLTIAYDDAAGRTPPVAVSGELGGLTVTPGVYKSSSSVGLTGVLTLDAQGDPNAVFVFQVASTLTTASGSRVKLINGAQPCNVFWQIGSSATLGTSSVFVGNILALTSISVNDAVTVNGRLLARNGAVTLINDTVTAAHCDAGTTPGGGGTTGGDTTSGDTTGTDDSTTGSDTTGTGTTGTPDGGTVAPGDGAALLTTSPRSVAKRIARYGIARTVSGRFKALVSGVLVRRVRFFVDGKAIGRQKRSPFAAFVRSGAGIHVLTARVHFTDNTPSMTLRLRYRVAADTSIALARRPRAPGGFAG